MPTSKSAEVVLFHSAYGLRPAVKTFADRLRAAGHRVHTPDLYQGKQFETLDQAVAHRDAIGIPTLIGRAQAAVAELPAELVYAGFSMGSAPAELLAAARPGTRGAILMHGALPPAAIGVEGWPKTVPVQIHYAEGDQEMDVSSVNALEAAAKASGAGAEVFVYKGGAGHLFADEGLPDYHAESAKLMLGRVLAFLAGLG